jgi:hypothetical protein
MASQIFFGQNVDRCMVYEAPWERYCHPQTVFQAKSEENPQSVQRDRIKRLYIFYDNIDIAGLS